MIFGHSSNKTTLVIVDIATDSVQAALVSLTPGSSPEILNQTKCIFDLYSSDDQDRIVLTNVKNAVSKLKVKVRFEEILLSVSSSVLESEVKTINITKSKEFPLDLALINHFLGEEVKSFRRKIETKRGKRVVVLQPRITEIEVNGYQVGLPLKSKITNANISFLLSAISKDFLLKLEDAIMSGIGARRKILLENFMYAFYKTSVHSYSGINSGVLISKNNEVIELARIEHGALINIKTLPFGHRISIDAISKSLNISSVLAHSYITLYEEGYLIGEIGIKIEEVLKPFKEQYEGELEKSKILKAIDSTNPKDDKLSILASYANIFNQSPQIARFKL